MSDGIKYVSALEDSGYDHAARAYLRGLLRAGVPVTWHPLVAGPQGYRPFGGETSGDGLLDAALRRDVAYETVLLHTTPEHYPVWRRREPGKRLVGYTTWETTKLQTHWIPLLNELDLVLVPSRWNARVFRRSGVTTPIRVVPHVYEPPPPEVAPLPGIGAGVMVFYTIGPWTFRKAPWRTLEAYWRAFLPEDPSLLVIKADGPDWTQASQGALWRLAGRRLFTSRRALRTLERKKPSSPPVWLIDRSVPDAMIQSLHARGDCYVSLSSAEGWGLGAFDAAGRGRPVIMTGFGGQLDYLTASDAYLVDYRLEEPVGVGRLAMPGSWAIPDVSHASRLMRRVFEDREASRLRGMRLGRHVVEHFREPLVIEQLLKALGDGHIDWRG